MPGFMLFQSFLMGALIARLHKLGGLRLTEPFGIFLRSFHIVFFEVIIQVFLLDIIGEGAGMQRLDERTWS